MGYLNMVVIEEGQIVSGRIGIVVDGDLPEEIAGWIKKEIPVGDREWLAWRQSVWVDDSHRERVIERFKETFDTIVIEKVDGSSRVIERGGESEQGSLL